MSQSRVVPEPLGRDRPHKMVPGMALTDDDLLDFDEERLADYDAAKARRDLEEHGDAFRYQLVAARQIEQWAERDDVSRSSPTADQAWLDGHARALRDIAAHLRLGHYLPGGRLYDETVAG
jgi:hypothetical protein